MIPFPWPAKDAVHIHCLALATGVVRYVSPDEIARADRLRDSGKRDSFIAGRGLLREILGGYLGIKVEDLGFAAGEHGKPYLTGHNASNERLYFNLSHSGALFILAVAADREVGIDAEQLRDDTPFADMARFVCSPHEQKELFTLSAHEQRDAFYRCWTRKEAYLKACGSGFSLMPNSFDINFFESPYTAFISPDNRSHWILQDIPVPNGYIAALAVKGSVPTCLLM